MQEVWLQQTIWTIFAAAYRDCAGALDQRGLLFAVGWDFFGGADVCEL